MSERILDYLNNPNHQKIEVGNVTPSDLSVLVQRVPLTPHPAHFSMSFRRSEGVVPNSTGELYCNGRWLMGKVDYTQDIATALKGGRLEVLRADIPQYNEGIEGVFDAGARFE